MFGYKLEIWKYDSAQCQEAEKHLYEMAEKGYEFTGVKRHMWPLVVYKKQDEPIRKKYSVAVMPGEDAALIELCKESGWEMLGHDNLGMTVMASDNPDARPIFTDEETRLEMWKEMFEKHKTNQMWGYIIVGALYVWLLSESVKVIERLQDFTFTAVAVLMLIVLGLWAGTALVEKKIMREQYQCIMEGTEYERPAWISKFYKIKVPVTMFMFVAVILIVRLPLLMSGMIWPLLVAAVNLILFFTGVILYGSGTHPKMGVFLIFLVMYIEILMNHISLNWTTWSRVF